MRFQNRSNTRISQRDYARYVLGLLPASVAINFLAALIATAILLPWRDMVVAMIGTQIIGTCMLIGAVSMRWVREFLLPPQPEGFPWHLFFGVPPGLVIGCVLASHLLRYDILELEKHHHPVVIIFVIVGCGVLGTAYFSVRWRAAREQWRSQRAQRTAVSARLRALQAQVEPHFLFNTLANLNALICQSPHDARLLLGHLEHYLRASLSHGREPTASLATELSLLEAYLKIMVIRLPDRLRIHVACAPECGALPFPPMLLQPLVENAVIHGIEPSREGGEIRIDAYIADKHLHIDVCDSGIGLRHAAVNPLSNGTGVENVRERLSTLFGKHASLSITDRLPRGTRASMRISLTRLRVAALAE